MEVTASATVIEGHVRITAVLQNGFEWPTLGFGEHHDVLAPVRSTRFRPRPVVRPIAQLAVDVIHFTDKPTLVRVVLVGLLLESSVCVGKKG